MVFFLLIFDSDKFIAIHIYLNILFKIFSIKIYISKNIINNKHHISTYINMNVSHSLEILILFNLR